MRYEIKALLAYIAGKRILQIALLMFGASLLLTLIIGLTQNVYVWLDIAPPAGIASIDAAKLGMVIGTAGTAAAVLVSLYVTGRGHRVASLTMDLTVERVPVSEKYDAVIVTLNAKNTGTGLCDVDLVHWAIKVLSPYDDEGIEGMQQEFDTGSDIAAGIEFPWRDAKPEATVSPNMSIEPNETEQMTHDFIIPAEIKAIVVSAWVENASTPKHTEGWYRRAVHTNREDEG